jgi:hypothetical protein
MTSPRSFAFPQLFFYQRTIRPEFPFFLRLPISDTTFISSSLGIRDFRMSSVHAAGGTGRHLSVPVAFLQRYFYGVAGLLADFGPDILADAEDMAGCVHKNA